MRDIDGKTQLIGLLGWPVSHTFSPAMHNAAAAAAGLNWVYVPLPVHPDDVQTAVSALSALGFRGVNVTVPYKQAVMPFLDEVEEGAQAIGAVNAIVVQSSVLSPQSSVLIGHNTDWSGFLADLREQGVAVNGRDCLILGAGGSARAVAYALASVGARVRVLARRAEQAMELVQRLRPFFTNAVLQAGSLTELTAVAQSLTAPLIVNTTPLGMFPNVGGSPWPDERPFPDNSFVYDLVYNPLQTKLMQKAQSSGCRAANGLGMLIHQGAEAFRLWTGVQPDVVEMRKAIQ